VVAPSTRRLCEVIEELASEVIRRSTEMKRHAPSEHHRRLSMQIVKAHGAEIPALGFGVFRMSDAEVERVVPAALEVGFTHFDTAQIYGNEAALGRAFN
jgi:hypothetical protein